MRTLIHKSLKLNRGDFILKEYDYKGKPCKIAFEITAIIPIRKRVLTNKLKSVGFGKLRRKVKIYKEHAKKGYIVNAIVYYSDNPIYEIFNDSDDYCERHFPIMFQRIKYNQAKFYLLDESETLLYKGL